MQYRQIESLQEYAFAWQSQPRIEIYRRQSGGHWLFSEFAGMENSCRFDSVAAWIPLSEVYRDIAFNEEGPPFERPSVNA
jgi:Uma2 family endonuclease